VLHTLAQARAHEQRQHGDQLLWSLCGSRRPSRN
jgi:hypothetical protein